jgi:hypothetical protein
MAIVLSDTGMKYEATAYVCGSEEQRERQKDEIQEHFYGRLLEGDFVSDWRVVERRRKDTEQDNIFMLVVTDLQVLSRDPKEWAERVIAFVEDTGALPWPLKYEHRERWGRNCRAVDGMDKECILAFLERQYDRLIEEAGTKSGKAE